MESGSSIGKGNLTSIIVIAAVVAFLTIMFVLFTGKPSLSGSCGVPDAKSNLADYNKSEVQRFLECNRGKPVVIDLWATWCGYCMSSIEDKKQLFTHFGDKIGYLALSYDDPAKKKNVSDVAGSRHINYPVVFADSNGRFFIEELINRKPAFPTLLYFDKAGNLVDIGVGKEAKEQIQQRIQRLL